MISNPAMLVALALVAGGALYATIRWRRAPQARRAMIALAACYFVAGVLATIALRPPRPLRTATAPTLAILSTATSVPTPALIPQLSPDGSVTILRPLSIPPIVYDPAHAVLPDSKLFKVPILDPEKQTKPFFHMTDFISRQKQFRNDWTDDTRNAFVGRLSTLASENTILGVGCGLIREEYEHSIPVDIRGEWRDPWYFLVFSCLSTLVGVQKIYQVAVPSPIYCLFDCKNKFVEMAGRIFYATKDDQEIDSKRLLGEMAFGSKEEIPPLQAVDLLAYSVVRNWVEEQHNPDKHFKTYEVLNSRRTLFTPFLRSQHLRTYVEFVRRRQAGEAE